MRLFELWIIRLVNFAFWSHIWEKWASWQEPKTDGCSSVQSRLVDSSIWCMLLENHSEAYTWKAKTTQWMQTNKGRWPGAGGRRSYCSWAQSYRLGWWLRSGDEQWWRLHDNGNVPAAIKGTVASHSSTLGRRSLVWGHKESNTTERLHFHFSLSCIEEGNGNPLQCSCLENPRDGGAWWAAVYGVAWSRTWLKRLSSSRHS